ncbi:MAG: hypothetical protein JHC98_11955 [Thermoleophilaceae bacterium]|nr:hypothetical protein [Thermoleophilaceae bacterium]
MAANSPRKRNNGGRAPLPISALPLPADDAPPSADAPAAGLPVNSSGELTPAQRARLGLDVYGDPPAPTPISNGNGNKANAATPEPQPAPSAQPSEFGFTEIDPFVEPEAPSAPEPRLAPAASLPKLAPATPAGTRVRQRTSLDDHDEADDNAGSGQRKRKQTIDERDGTPQMDRDRKVLTYGVSWTFFCLFVSAAISFGNIFSSAGEGASPGTFVPALVSILIGWVIVFIARNMGPNWGWLMLIPAVVLVLGPFFYTSWRLGQTEAGARAYLSTTAAKSGIDIDQSTIVSETINTPQGCFAFTKIRESGDVTIDVVTYAPATAQQQATMALAPRFARRVEPGGSRANQRTFVLDKGTLPVVVETRISPPIDCAGASAP